MRTKRKFKDENLLLDDIRHRDWKYSYKHPAVLNIYYFEHLL